MDEFILVRSRVDGLLLRLALLALAGPLPESALVAGLNPHAARAAEVAHEAFPADKRDKVIRRREDGY